MSEPTYTPFDSAGNKYGADLSGKKHDTKESIYNLPPLVSEPTPREELREKLAAIEHERWADWQKWCHQVLRENAHDIEPVLQRWDKQIATPYARLSAQEQVSDMEQVNRYWPLVEEYANAEVLAVLDELENTGRSEDEFRDAITQLKQRHGGKEQNHAE